MGMGMGTMVAMPPPPSVAVGGILIEPSPDGPCVLLIRRGHPPSEGRWSLPGGRIEPGERIVDAVVREMHEETGLVVAVGGLVEVVEIIEPAFHYVILDHACRRTGGTLVAGDDAAAVELVPIARLPERGVTDLVRAVVSKALGGWSRFAPSA